MSDIEQALVAVKDVYVNYPKRYDIVQDEIRKCEQEIMDLEHALEFSNFNASQGYKLAKDIQKARQKRRKLKNELELLEIVKRLNAFPKPSERHLNQAIGDIRKVEKNQEGRSYTMRIRQDLQEMVIR